MNQRVKSIIEHMLEDANDIIAFSQSVGSLEELRKNSLIKKGIVMSLLIEGKGSNFPTFPPIIAPAFPPTYTLTKMQLPACQLFEPDPKSSLHIHPHCFIVSMFLILYLVRLLA